MVRKKKINNIDIKYSKIRSALNYFKSNIPAPSGLIITFGSRGSGKSTDIAKDFYRWKTKHKDYKSYNDFYTNIYINTTDEHYHYLDLVNYKITDYMPINDKTKKGQCYTEPKTPTPFKINENSIICIDELGIFAHSRDFKNFPKEFIHLVKYLRKLGILLKANSQSYDIDKTLREGASDLRLKRKLINLSFSRRINKKIVCDNPSDTPGITAEQQIHDELTFASILSKGGIEFTYIPFYTDLFNSFE